MELILHTDFCRSIEFELGKIMTDMIQACNHHAKTAKIDSSLQNFNLICEISHILLIIHVLMAELSRVII